MKLQQQQLQQHLTQQLAPIYFIFGDEAVLVNECVDAIRSATKNQGYGEPIRLTASQHFDWQQLHQATQELSLFSRKQFIELHLPTGKPGAQGSKALTAYASQPPDDVVLLIRSAKLDSASQKTKWFKSIEQAGVVIAIWPLRPQQLTSWLQHAFASAQLGVDHEGLQCLIERTEGNLLAAKQAITHLSLLFGNATVSAEQIAEAIGNNQQFTLFECVDNAMLGKAERAYQMFSQLRQAGLEPTLLLWALTREIKALAVMAFAVAQGENLAAVLQSHRVWDKRKPVVSYALQQHSLTALQQLVTQAHAIDRLIKGASVGNVWQQLCELLFALSGKPLFYGQELV